MLRSMNIVPEKFIDFVYKYSDIIFWPSQIEWIHNNDHITELKRRTGKTILTFCIVLYYLHKENVKVMRITKHTPDHIYSFYTPKVPVIVKINIESLIQYDLPSTSYTTWKNWCTNYYEFVKKHFNPLFDVMLGNDTIRIISKFSFVLE